jgi:hypothetical protein
MHVGLWGFSNCASFSSSPFISASLLCEVLLVVVHVDVYCRFVYVQVPTLPTPMETCLDSCSDLCTVLDLLLLTCPMGPVSHQVCHDKDPSLFKALSAEHIPKFCSLSPAMVTSQYK